VLCDCLCESYNRLVPQTAPRGRPKSYKDGHYVVAPPSLHPSGRRYEWACDEGPGEVELADVPERWLTAMRKRSPAPSRASGDHDDPLREIPPPEYFAKLANGTPSRDGKVSCPIPGHRD